MAASMVCLTAARMAASWAVSTVENLAPLMAV